MNRVFFLTFLSKLEWTKGVLKQLRNFWLGWRVSVVKRTIWSKLEAPLDLWIMKISFFARRLLLLKDFARSHREVDIIICIISMLFVFGCGASKRIINGNARVWEILKSRVQGLVASSDFSRVDTWVCNRK